jgi:hypothetical protein
VRLAGLIQLVFGLGYVVLLALSRRPEDDRGGESDGFVL